MAFIGRRGAWKSGRERERERERRERERETETETETERERERGWVRRDGVELGEWGWGRGAGVMNWR